MIRLPLPALLAASVLVALVVAGCGGNDDKPTTKIVEAPPWTGEEHLFYQLTQKGVKGNADCELQTLPSAPAGGAVTLTRLCNQAEHRDDSTAEVDARTLQPQKTSRTYSDSKQGKRTVYTNTYGPATVHFELNADGKVRAADRDLPKPTSKSPDPGWYDDDETLWLVRSIPLQPGFTGTFTYVINAGQPRLLATDAHVDKAETIRVPAGDFRAFRVRLVKDDVVWAYWVEEAAPHRVIRAQIEDSTYELTRAQ